jgi:predicted RNA-binding Zn ribbon-like protein
MNTENYAYQFVGGNLALDFVNTVGYRFDAGKRIDHLQTIDELRRWADQAGLRDRSIIDRVILSTSERANKKSLDKIRPMREQIFSIFHAVASSQPIPREALRCVGDAFNACSARRILSARKMKVDWVWWPNARCPDFLLLPILTAAMELLLSRSLELVRHCDDPGCGWLFLDRSNAGKRRWCRMADCGNRQKAREHYRRNTVGLVHAG